LEYKRGYHLKNFSISFNFVYSDPKSRRLTRKNLDLFPKPMMYQDIPVLGDPSTANVIDEERKILIHALAKRMPDFDFINSPLHTLASVAAQGLGKNHPYHFLSGEKEKDPAFVPITAPVPLYAVRGKAALQSILSIGEEEGECMRQRLDATSIMPDVFIPFRGRGITGRFLHRARQRATNICAYFRNQV